MARWLLVAATVVDIGLAVLLIAISGFIVGSGPESMHAGGWGTAALTAAVLSCVAAPIVGFALLAFKRPAGGILIAWLPPIAGLVVLMIPPPY